jgi:hypothetical protein
MTPEQMQQLVEDMAEALGVTVDDVLAMTWTDLERQRRRLIKEAEAAQSAVDDIDNVIQRAARTN